MEEKLLRVVMRAVRDNIGGYDLAPAVTALTTGGSNILCSHGLSMWSLCSLQLLALT